MLGAGPGDDDNAVGRDKLGSDVLNAGCSPEELFVNMTKENGEGETEIATKTKKCPGNNNILCEVEFVRQ